MYELNITDELSQAVPVIHHQAHHANWGLVCEWTVSSNKEIQLKCSCHSIYCKFTHILSPVGEILAKMLK